MDVETELERRGFHIETLPCRLCQAECSLATEYVRLGGLQICGDCADIVANVYSMKHSGAWLTWPNARHPKVGFQKRPIPSELRWEVFERDDFTCQECRSRRLLEAHHVIPESMGGPTTIENLLTLCKPCNGRKGNRV